MGFFFKNNNGVRFVFVESGETLEEVCKHEYRHNDRDISPDDFSFFTDMDNIVVDESRYIVDKDDKGLYRNYMKVNNEASTVYVLQYAHQSLNKLFEYKGVKKTSDIKIYYDR